MGPLLVFAASFIMVFFIALIFMATAIGTLLALSHLVEWVVSGSATADASVNAAERYLTDDRP